MKQGNV
jgi:hypothetical protein